MSESAAPVAAPAPAAAADTSPPSPAPSNGEDKAAATPTKQKPPQFRKIKTSDGQEVSLSDEDIARDYSKWKGADAKFREAAEARKSVEAFMKALEEDPESVLSNPKLPLNRRKLAEKWLTEQVEAELNPADPRDKKLSEAERKLKEYEERDAAAKKDSETKAYEAEREQRKGVIAKTLSEAMKATHLSAHPEMAAEVLREMAMYMRAAKERDTDVTPEELVAHVHNSRFQQFYTLAHQFEGEELIEFFGEEIVSRLRKADLARLRAGRDQGQQHRSEGTADARSNRSKAPKMDAIEARRHANKMLRG